MSDIWQKRDTSLMSEHVSEDMKAFLTRLANKEQQ